MVLLCPQPPSFPISSAYSTPPVKARILSVFIAVKHKSGTDSGPWLRRLALLRKGLPRMSRQYTPWGEGFPIALQPLESEVVVEKMRMSGFFGNLLGVLSAQSRH